MSTWQLKPGADQKIRAQHPWVMANELGPTTREILPGSMITLVDAKGNFLARGYGNPQSQIVFRALAFNSQVENPCSLEAIVTKTIKAWEARAQIGYQYSFRLVYGEGDFLPGLVIDRYLIETADGKIAQVLACQILTAGMQNSINLSEQILMRFFELLIERAGSVSDISWDQTAIVVRNDVNVRKLEGLTVEKPKILKEIPGIDLSSVDILIEPSIGKKVLKMRCDLAHGQKTGFFLDQAKNISLLCQQIQKAAWQGPVRILDLCCYVGQWSSQIARCLAEMGVECECTLVDVSEVALQHAEFNVSRAGAKVVVHKGDVLDSIDVLESNKFDIVIADPPAFIKAKKDLATGKHAYMKLNSSAFRLAKKKGWVVSCSCSGLLQESDLMDAIGKSLRRNQVQARCLVRGGHAPDHPCLVSFPEGFYLKMYLHQVESSLGVF